MIHIFRLSVTMYCSTCNFSDSLDITRNSLILVRQRLPGFMRESPLDGDVARKVKRAANSIDKFR